VNAEQTGKNVLCSAIYLYHLSFMEFFPDIYAEGKSDINVIVGTTKVTEGTDENDVIIGCSYFQDVPLEIPYLQGWKRCYLGFICRR
jgi:hypothetical protein